MMCLTDARGKCQRALTMLSLIHIGFADFKISRFISVPNMQKNLPGTGEEPWVFGAQSATGCSIRCASHTQCMAFNVCKSQFQGFPVRCEIFSKKALISELVQSTCGYYENVIPCQNCGHYDEINNKCVCSRGYIGERCHRLIRDCSEGWHHNFPSGEYRIQPKHSPKSFKVFCQNTVSGGMTHVMYRNRWDQKLPLTDFRRTWKEYKQGFGKSHINFWLGNEHLHEITRQGLYTLDVGVAPRSIGDFRHAYYQAFSVGSEEERYGIHLGSFSSWSQVNNSLTPAWDPNRNINGKPFSTIDNDVSGGCPGDSGSGWWFAPDCTAGNLNGPITDGGLKINITWDYNFKNQEITGAYMQIRAESYYEEM